MVRSAWWSPARPRSRPQAALSAALRCRPRPAERRPIGWYGPPTSLYPLGVTVSARLVVLVSGAGTNLQALLDACADPAYGATVVAVGADRDGIEGLARAERAGVPTFVRRVKDFPYR